MNATDHAEPVIDVRAGVATDTGARRSHNEDSYLCQFPIYLVADGMGGYDAGEIASAAVVDTFGALAGLSHVDIDLMRDTYARAGRRVVELPSQHGSAGTTLTGCAVAAHDSEPYWLIINVGDSRTYRWAQGELEQLSVDHSVVQELIEAGELTSEQAVSDNRRNVVTRAIGAGAVSEADFWMIPAAKHDRMLVCSDGLSGELDDDRIADVLATHDDPEQAAQALVHEAIVRGGRDNITAIVVDAVAVNRAGDHDLDADTVPRETMSGGR